MLSFVAVFLFIVPTPHPPSPPVHLPRCILFFALAGRGVELHLVLLGVLPEQRAERDRYPRRRHRALLVRRQAHQGGRHQGRVKERVPGIDRS